MLHAVRQPHSEQKWDGALLRVWNAFGLPRMEQLCGTCNQWPPTIVDIPSGASEAWAEQLALQGVKCCNGKADNCGQSDWRLALSLCAAALQLCDGGLAWRGNWRSDAAWAVARFQLLRRAAEALRASGMHGKAKKAMDCLLQCEEILEISPHSIGVTETFQFYTYLAEARRRLRDSFGARSSCRKALRVTALRPESGDSYATLFVLWVLHRAALEVEELEELKTHCSVPSMSHSGRKSGAQEPMILNWNVASGCCGPWMHSTGRKFQCLTGESGSMRDPMMSTGC